MGKAVESDLFATSSQVLLRMDPRLAAISGNLWRPSKADVQVCFPEHWTDSDLKVFPAEFDTFRAQTNEEVATRVVRSICSLTLPTNVQAEPKASVTPSGLAGIEWYDTFVSENELERNFVSAELRR